MTLNTYITAHYKRLKQLAFQISRGADYYEDLLHDSLMSCFESKHIENLIEKDEFDYYLIRVMYLSVNSPTSRFYRKNIAWNRNRRAFVDKDYEEDKTWLGARMTNEQLDILISRLTEFERLIFLEYILEGYSYRTLSKETGIPTVFIYRTIDNIKQKLRNNVIR